MNWGWVAGIIEGEGTIGTYTTAGQSARHDCGDARAYIAVVMSDLDVIEKLVAVTGAGKINKDQRPRGNKSDKLLYRWRVNDKRDILNVLKNIWPFVGERRATAIRKIIGHLAKCPLTADRSRLEINLAEWGLHDGSEAPREWSAEEARA